MEKRIGEIQQYLEQEGLDGWLLYDFRGSNDVAMQIGPFQGIVSRRWYMLVPRKGKPVLLAHRIEEANIVGNWAEKELYSTWKELDEKLAKLLSNSKKIAMEYSPGNAIPYISKVDAGTVEKIRSFDVEIVSSANLVQAFTALWSAEDLKTHKVAANFLVSLMDDMFKYVADHVSAGKEINEYQVQQEILRRFAEMGMRYEHEPIVAVNEHAASPHYGPTEAVHSPIREGDLLLMDIFCGLNQGDSTQADITWTAYVGPEPVPAKMREVFSIVAAARDAGAELITRELEAGNPVAGWQVDDATRSVIEKAGYGEYFTHRTGHSLGVLLHYNGVNIDNFETRDERLLVPGVGFTIEPGIYLPGEFGIRSEINCHISEKGLEITTLPLQTELKALL
jgi:Xaa-Pro dipeptidase